MMMLFEFTNGLSRLSPGDIRRLSFAVDGGATELPCRVATLGIEREACRRSRASRSAITRAGREAGGAVLRAASPGGDLTGMEAAEVVRVARMARDIARGLSAGPAGARHAHVLLAAWREALASPPVNRRRGWHPRSGADATPEWRIAG